MAVKIENLARGDLVEISLTPDARKNLGLVYFFEPDISGETNISGRICIGYVADIRKNSISLISDWNKIQNKPEMGIGSYEVLYSFDTIESWRKLRKDL